MSQPDITLRPSTPEDLPAIYALNDLAFGQPDEARIVEELNILDDSLLSLVAVTKTSQIIGHIQYFPLSCVPEMEPTRFAGLGPMSVHPDVQKTGIGSQLIKASLDMLKTQGFQRIFVLGHPEYYPRFGFSVEETAGFAAPWGGPAFMALQLNSGGPGFGELHYPDAFSGG